MEKKSDIWIRSITFERYYDTKPSQRNNITHLLTVFANHMSNRKQHIDSNHKPKYSASMHQHCTFELRTYKVAPEHAATRSSEKQKDRWTISPSKVPITLPAATLPANKSMSKFMSKADMSD